MSATSFDCKCTIHFSDGTSRKISEPSYKEACELFKLGKPFDVKDCYGNKFYINPYHIKEIEDKFAA